MSKSLFKVVDWKEEFTVEEKVAHARATYSIEGDLNGSIEVDYTIFYLEYNRTDIHQSQSRFEGFMVFTGEYKGQKGSFSLYDKGSFLKNKYDSQVEIIKDSGEGDFEGILGNGSYQPTEQGMLLNLSITLGD